MGKNLAEDLRVLIAQTSSVDVFTAVGEPFEVRSANTSDSQLVKFVVFPYSSESNTVIDFADFAKRCRRVFGDDRNTVRKLNCN